MVTIPDMPGLPPEDPDADPELLELLDQLVDDNGEPVDGDGPTDERADLASAVDDMTRSGPGRPRSAAMPREPLSWLGAVKPSTAAVARELVEVADAAGLPLELVWGLSSTGEHRLGYSLDLMTWSAAGASHDDRVGLLLSRYVWSHRRRLGVRYLIWGRQIRNVEIGAGKWRAYHGIPHTDHVHVCRYPRVYLAPDLVEASRTQANASLTRGTRTNGAKYLQRALNVACRPSGGPLKVDGYAGALTRAAVVAWQRQIGAPRTGQLSQSDWHRLAIASGHYADATS